MDSRNFVARDLEVPRRVPSRRRLPSLRLLVGIGGIGLAIASSACTVQQLVEAGIDPNTVPPEIIIPDPAPPVALPTESPNPTPNVAPSPPSVQPIARTSPEPAPEPPAPVPGPTPPPTATATPTSGPTPAPTPATSPTPPPTPPPAPVAGDDAEDVYATIEARFGVLANDNPSGVTLLGIVDPPRSGSAACTPEGECRYLGRTPGTDQFTYRITDAFGQTDTAVVRLTVTDPGPAPAPVDDTMTVQRNVPGSIDVLANDLPAGLGGVRIADAPSRGTASCTSAGECTYTSSNDGGDRFVYEVSDRLGRTGRALVTVTITPPQNQAPVGNRPPRQVAGFVVTLSDADGYYEGFIDLDQIVVDPDGDPLTFDNFEPPAGNGSWCRGDGECLATGSNEWYYGRPWDDQPAGRTTARFTASDGRAQTEIVVEFNRAPQTWPVWVWASGSGPTTGVDPISWGEFSDPDNDLLALIPFDDQEAMSGNEPTGAGTLSCGDDNLCTFTPSESFSSACAQEGSPQAQFVITTTDGDAEVTSDLYFYCNNFYGYG